MRAFRCVTCVSVESLLMQFNEATCHAVWRNERTVRSLVLDGGKQSACCEAS